MSKISFPEFSIVFITEYEKGIKYSKKEKILFFVTLSFLWILRLLVIVSLYFIDFWYLHGIKGRQH